MAGAGPQWGEARGAGGEALEPAGVAQRLARFPSLFFFGGGAGVQTSWWMFGALWSLLLCFCFLQFFGGFGGFLEGFGGLLRVFFVFYTSTVVSCRR